MQGVKKGARGSHTLLEVVAHKLVPERPGRSEPRGSRNVDPRHMDAAAASGFSNVSWRHDEHYLRVSAIRVRGLEFGALGPSFAEAQIAITKRITASTVEESLIQAL